MKSANRTLASIQIGTGLQPGRFILHKPDCVSVIEHGFIIHNFTGLSRFTKMFVKNA